MTQSASVRRKMMEREARRRFILDAARRVLAEKTCEAVSMDGIAAAADYTRRTLYFYFKSRDEILLAVLTDDLVARWALQKKAIAGATNGMEKLRAWAEVLFAHSRDNPQTLHLQVYWDFRGVDPGRVGGAVFKRFESINTELADGLREIVRLGIRDGSLRPDLNVDLTISQFLHSLRAVLNRALSTTYSFVTVDPDEYVDHFLGLFFRSIRKVEGDAS